MALKGAYNYAGINLTEAYVRINDIHWISTGAMEMVETKPAVFDRPGGARIVQPAEFTKKWVDKTKQPTHTQYIKIKLQERHYQEQKSINLIQILTWTQKLMLKMQYNKHILI